MILKELVDLARRDGLLEDPDFEPKPVRWMVEIGKGGKLLEVHETRREDSPAKGKPQPLTMFIPKPALVRTSKEFAKFLVDGPDYVLGFDPTNDPKKQARLEDRRCMFRALIEQAANDHRDDAGLQALLCFLSDDAEIAKAIDKIRATAEAGDRVGFQYSDMHESFRIHDSDAARAAWKGLRFSEVETQKKPASPKRRKTSQQVDEGLVPSKPPACVACGAAVTSSVKQLLIQQVPGGTPSGVSLVLGGGDACDSFGLDSNESVTICQTCTDGYTAGLTRLLHRSYLGSDGKPLAKRSFRLSANTAAVYWTSGAKEHRFVNEFGEIDFADAGKAAPFFAAAVKGKDLPTDDPSPFYALLVSGAQGRATLRGYYQSTVGEIAKHARQYLDDIRIVRRYPNSPEYPALSWLVRSLAAQGKSENVDADLAGRLFLAILDGSPFPREVLAAAVRRIRSEREDSRGGKHSRERLALIRATLNRWWRKNDPRITSLIQKEVSEVLDVECTSPGYCLGRLFAALEKIQADAIGKPNATITDRFYGAASATPVVVFAPLLRKAQHHIAKFEEGLQTYWGKTIQSILGLLKPADAFPSTLTLEEQGLFALGYYHQRAAIYQGKPAEKAAETPAAE